MLVSSLLLLGVLGHTPATNQPAATPQVPSDFDVELQRQRAELDHQRAELEQQRARVDAQRDAVSAHEAQLRATASEIHEAKSRLDALERAGEESSEESTTGSTETSVLPPRWKSRDGAHQFGFNSRVHADGRTGFGPTRFDFYTRRARLTASGSAFHDRVGVKLGLEFGRTTDADVRDAFINLRLHDVVQLRVGQQLVPFSTERLTSSNYMKHPERPIIVDQLAAQRDVGLMLWGEAFGGGLEYYAGVFNGGGENAKGNDDRALDVIGRLTGQVAKPLFIAASYRYTPPHAGDFADDGGSLGSNGRSVGGVGRTFLELDPNGTHFRYGARHRAEIGPRVRWRFLELKSEFQLDRVMDVRFADDTGKSMGSNLERYTNWSVFVDGSIVLTGEDQVSKDISPRRPLFEAGRVVGPGAFELNLRFEHYHADDTLLGAGVAAGDDTVDAGTGTLIWTAMPGFRILASFSRSQFSRRGEAPAGTPASTAPEHLLLVRTDFHF